MQMLQDKLLPIVLVDDDIDECQLFCDALQDLGIKNEIICFHSGNDLIQFAEDGKVTPLLAFIDLHISMTSGIELIEIIKLKENFKKTTIALYSNSILKKDYENALNAGADLYIQKPNTFEKLKSYIIEAFEKAQPASTKIEDFEKDEMV